MPDVLAVIPDRYTVPSVSNDARWELSKGDDRLWPKVDTSGDCWEWLAYRNPAGYGIFSYGGRERRAHRVVWQVLVGEISDGLEIDHLCRNRGCVNPDHLEPVTRLENLRRGIQRSGNSGMSHCRRGHPFTEDNTYLWKNSVRFKRVCLMCAKLRMREYRRGK